VILAAALLMGCATSAAPEYWVDATGKQRTASAMKSDLSVCYVNPPVFYTEENVQAAHRREKEQTTQCMSGRGWNPGKDWAAFGQFETVVNDACVRSCPEHKNEK
jgi:hypothetical protein